MEIVLWVFIIFLLVVIGLLTYSHLQLLTTLNDEGTKTIFDLKWSQDDFSGTISFEMSSTRAIQSPPLAHRPGLPGLAPLAHIKEGIPPEEEH